MPKRFNGIFLIPFFVLPIVLFAQQSSVSPYSKLGLGDFQPQNYIRSLSFGGANLALRQPINVSPESPASYSDLQLTTFELGLYYRLIEQKQSNPDITLNNNTSGIRYFSFGIPLTDWWGTAAGLQPYTAKGYEINQNRVGPDSMSVMDQFSGSGGLNRLYWGNSFEVAKGLSLGVNASYLFGRLEEQNAVFFQEGLLNTSVIEERARIRGFKFDFGARYLLELNEKTELGLGVTFANKSNLKADVEQKSYVVDATGVSLDTLDQQPYNSNVTLPNEFGFGLSLSGKSENPYLKPWAVNADFELYEGSAFVNYDGRKSLADGYRVELGGFVIPAMAFNEKKNQSTFLGRVEYRLGGFYENTPYTVAGTQLQDYGITFGMGIPVRARNLAPGETKVNTINIGAILGRRGTLENGLIQESYLNIYLGITLNDKWFLKYKYR